MTKRGKRKNLYLAGGSENGIQWKLRLAVCSVTLKFSGYFQFEVLNSRKVRIRQNDQKWVHNNIPSSLWWGSEIHHDWENGARMYLLTIKEHRRIHHE